MPPLKQTETYCFTSLETGVSFTSEVLEPGKEFLLSGREVRTHGLRREQAEMCAPADKEGPTS